MYEFIEQLLTPTIAAVTGQPATMAMWTSYPQAFNKVPPPTDNEVRLLWRALVEAARATVGKQFGSWEVTIPADVALEFTGDSMVITPPQGPTVPLPVGRPIVGPRLEEGRYRVSLRRRTGDIELFAARKG